MIKALEGWLLYIAPFLLAWYRKSQGKPIVTTLPMIFMMNFFLGWTVVGWIIPLLSALNINAVAWVALRLFKVLPKAGGAGMPMGGGGSQGGGASHGGAACSMCGGSGSMMCSSCQGRGSWYDPPSGATGQAQLRNCGACTSSGRLRCSYCGGSGRAAASL